MEAIKCEPESDNQVIAGDVNQEKSKESFSEERDTASSGDGHFVDSARNNEIDDTEVEGQSKDVDEVQRLKSIIGSNGDVLEVNSEAKNEQVGLNGNAISEGEEKGSLDTRLEKGSNSVKNDISQTQNPPLIYYENDQKFANMMKFINNNREQGKYCDTVLEVGDKKYFAHSCVLAANSPHFDKILGGGHVDDQHTSFKLSVPTENKEVADVLIEYMYTANLGVNMEIVGELMKVAHELGMTDVLQCCGVHLTKELNIFNWLEIKMIADRYNLESVIIGIKKLVAEKMSKISQSTLFLDLDEDRISSILTDCNPEKKHNVEHNIVNAILSWVCHKMDERLSAYANLVKLLHPELLNSRSVMGIMNLPYFKSTDISSHETSIELIGRVSLREKMRPKESIIPPEEEEGLPSEERLDPTFKPIRNKRGRPPKEDHLISPSTKRRRKRNRAVAKKSTGKLARSFSGGVAVKKEIDEFGNEVESESVPEENNAKPDEIAAQHDWSLNTTDLYDQDDGPNKGHKREYISRCCLIM